MRAVLFANCTTTASVAVVVVVIGDGGGISNGVDDGCAMVALLWLVLHKSKIQLDCSLYSFFISCFIIP